MMLTPVAVTLIGFIAALAGLAGTFLILKGLRAVDKRPQ